jgi:hypothetical protein
VEWSLTAQRANRTFETSYKDSGTSNIHESTEQAGKQEVRNQPTFIVLNDHKPSRYL